MKFKALLLALALGLGAAGSASAAVIVSVAGTAMPWLWSSGGLNDAYQFGVQDGTGPTVIDLASAGITPGGGFAVIYVSGLTSAFGGPPTVDVDGYVGSVFANDQLGSSGTRLPSFYMPQFWDLDSDGDAAPGGRDGVFLNALVGTFTDSTGQIVPDSFSSPLAVGFVYGKGNIRVTGIGPRSPAGATQLQLGVNDDIFSDNTGSMQVCVGTWDACIALVSPPAPAPEPTTWALMIGGMSLLGAALRRRRSAAFAA